MTYVDPSADAAIAGTYKDFKFKNNTDAPIYIEGATAGKTILPSFLSAPAFLFPSLLHHSLQTGS